MRTLLLPLVAVSVILFSHTNEFTESQMRSVFERSLAAEIADAMALVAERGGREAVEHVRMAGNNRFEIRTFRKGDCQPMAMKSGFDCSFTVNIALANGPMQRSLKGRFYNAPEGTQFALDAESPDGAIPTTISLFALKVSGLVFDGGYTLTERLQGRNNTGIQMATSESIPDYPKIIIADKQVMPDAPLHRQSWAQEMFDYNDASNRDVTGLVGAKKSSEPPLKTSDKPPNPPKLDVGGTTAPLEPGRIASAGERAVLERLQDRSKELDTRGRDLEMRESLLKVTEKRLDAKVAELKDVEARVNTAMGNRDKAEAQRFKSVVAMYENMKSKDAARILERLDMKILAEVATQIKPAKMSEILAQMSPEAGERLTVELANRAGAAKSQNPGPLPKIDGTPNGD